MTTEIYYEPVIQNGIVQDWKDDREYYCGENYDPVTCVWTSRDSGLLIYLNVITNEVKHRMLIYMSTFLTFMNPERIDKFINSLKNNIDYDIGDIFEHPMTYSNNKIIFKSILEHSGVTSETIIQLNDHTRELFIAEFQKLYKMLKK